MTLVALQKSKLRKQLRAERSQWLGMQPGTVHSQLTEQVRTLFASGSYRSVFGFWPFGSEPDLRPWYRQLMADPEVTLALPAIRQARQRGGTAEMVFVAVSSEQQLAPREPYGILEPALGEAVDVDSRLSVADDRSLIVVPALAVDARGYRLGYGGGFYDRFLASSPASTTVATVFQPFFPRVLSVAPHDISVGYVATDLCCTRL